MRIEGIQQFRDGLRKFEDEVALGIESGLEAEVREMQREAADLVPVDEGTGRATLLLPEAIRVEKSPDGPGKRVVFGFITPAMKRAAYYLFWVEFGTKGYAAGDRRVAGKSKSGRTKFTKVKRTVPPRPAQPFWRPAEANLWRRLENRLNMQRLVTAAKRAVSLADKD